MIVHLIAHRQPEYLFELSDALPPDSALTWGPEPPDPAGVHVLVDGFPTRERLQACMGLRALVVPFAGLPARTVSVLREHERDLPIYNLHHNASAVAESAVALLFAAAKAVVPMDRALRTGDWRPRYAADPGVQLAGRRALLVGYGAIGHALAPMLMALGMRVRAVRRTSGTQLRDGIAVVGVDQLDAELENADVLVLALPSTPETRELIDAARIERLPVGAIVVNVARGDVLDDVALYEALRTRRLHSAGIDVWRTYPRSEAQAAFVPPSRAPFWELDNCVLSPHRAGHGVEVERARAVMLASTLAGIATGDGTRLSRVDLQRGY